MDIVFQFSSLQELFNMDGHGVYVWSAYLLSAVGIAYVAIAPMMAKRRFLKTQSAILRRKGN